MRDICFAMRGGVFLKMAELRTTMVVPDAGAFEFPQVAIQPEHPIP